jgi:glycosyltransferase 2 family protein
MKISQIFHLKIPRKAVIGLKVVAAFLILTWLWQSGRIDLRALERIVDPVWGPLLLGTTMVSLGVFSMRLFVLARTYNFIQSPFEAWRLSLTGLFFNFVLPGGTGGDLVKIIQLSQKQPQAALWPLTPQSTRAAAITVVALDRIIGLLGMLGLAVVSFLLRLEVVFAQRDLQILFAFTGIGFLAVLLGLSLAYRFPILRRLGVTTLPSIPVLALSLLFTLISQSLAVVILILSAMAAGYQGLDWASFFIVGPLGLLLSAIPISPGGLGIGQLAFFALFKMYSNVDSDLGATVITVYQVLLFLVSLSGLYYYLTAGPVSGSGSGSGPGSTSGPASAPTSGQV